MGQKKTVLRGKFASSSACINKFVRWQTNQWYTLRTSTRTNQSSKEYIWEEIITLRVEIDEIVIKNVNSEEKP